MIPLLQTKTADTAHTGIFVSVTSPLPHFWAGPGDDASGEILYRARDHVLGSADCD